MSGSLDRALLFSWLALLALGSVMVTSALFTVLALRPSLRSVDITLPAIT